MRETQDFPWREKRAALIIAHPGHELRAHHWLETARPETLVLTDGSGRNHQSRLASTTRTLAAAGARPGSIYGRFTDAQIYAAMLENRHEIFIGLMREMAAFLVAGQFEYVVADALEGYNPSHEACRYLVGAACELAQGKSGRTIRNFDFLLTGRPDECPAALQAGAIHLSLDAAALQRKLAAAEAYPELKREVDGALKKFGMAVFATEWLRPVANHEGVEVSPEKPPFYEIYGEMKKAGGDYQQVIRQREHLLPLARALWAAAQTT